VKKNICAKFQKLKNKTIIGLTGAAASGKSAVLDQFRQLGAYCVSTDSVTKELLTSGACCNILLERFGPGVFQKNGSIDRKKLAKEIFSDKSKRKLLESILHPEILNRTFALIKKSHEKIIVVEAPLLFEAGLEKCFALTVCVDAPYRMRIERAAARGWSYAEFRRRNAAQLPAEEKAKRADVVMGNEGTLKELRSKTDHLFKFLKRSV